MARGTVHAALIMCAYFPILPAKACVTMAASTQIGGAVHRHGGLGMISGGRAMTGFTCHAIGFVGGGSRIVPCCVTNQAGAGLALLIPLFQKDWITAGF